MPLHISADTALRVDTNADGSLTLHFDRKRPLDTETTAIEETTDVDVTGTVADDTATPFALKRHKTGVFSEKMALAKTLVALQDNDARTAAIKRMFCRAMRAEARRSPNRDSSQVLFRSFSAA